MLGSALGSASQAIQQREHSLVLQLMHYGFTSADAASASLGIVYEQLLRQSLFLSFMDCFRVVALHQHFGPPSGIVRAQVQRTGRRPGWTLSSPMKFLEHACHAL